MSISTGPASFLAAVAAAAVVSPPPRGTILPAVSLMSWKKVFGVAVADVDGARLLVFPCCRCCCCPAFRAATVFARVSVPFPVAVLGLRFVGCTVSTPASDELLCLPSPVSSAIFAAHPATTGSDAIPTKFCAELAVLFPAWMLLPDALLASLPTITLFPLPALPALTVSSPSTNSLFPQNKLPHPPNFCDRFDTALRTEPASSSLTLNASSSPSASPIISPIFSV